MEGIWKRAALKWCSQFKLRQVSDSHVWSGICEFKDFHRGWITWKSHNVCDWERGKKERNSSLCRWILIKYWWSAVLKAWLGPDWAKHTHTHTLTSDTHRWRTSLQNRSRFSLCLPLVNLPPSSPHFSLSPSCILPPLPPVTHTDHTHRKQHVQSCVHAAVALCPWWQFYIKVMLQQNPFSMKVILLKPFQAESWFTRVIKPHIVSVICRVIQPWR